MKTEEKQKIFEPMYRNFETENIKAYFMDMVAEIPDYILQCPVAQAGNFTMQRSVKHMDKYITYICLIPY